MKDLWIPIFKTGKHPDSQFPDTDFDTSFIKRIVDKYNNQPEEQRHVAPLILDDHNEFADDKKTIKKPAMGWVEKLKVAGEKLMAKIKPTPELVDHVRNNRYKTLSMSVTDDLLKHVAILGAVAPAVKGLPMLDFSEESKEKIINYEFSQEEIDQAPAMVTIINFDEKIIRDAIASEFENIASKYNFSTIKDEDMPTPLKEFRDAMRRRLKEQTSDDVAAKFDAIFSEEVGKFADLSKGQETGDKENNPQADKNTPLVQNYTETEEYKRQQQEIENLKAANRRSEFSSFLDQHKDRIIPAMRPNAMDMLELAYQSDVKGIMQFTADDKPITAVEKTKQMLASYPVQVDFNEYAENGAEQNESQNIDEAIKKWEGK